MFLGTELKKKKNTGCHGLFAMEKPLTIQVSVQDVECKQGKFFKVSLASKTDKK